MHVSLADGMIETPGELPAGPATFEVTNDGSMEHIFQLEGQGIEQVFDANLQPGESNTMQVDSTVVRAFVSTAQWTNIVLNIHKEVELAANEHAG